MYILREKRDQISKRGKNWKIKKKFMSVVFTILKRSVNLKFSKFKIWGGKDDTLNVVE